MCFNQIFLNSLSSDFSLVPIIIVSSQFHNLLFFPVLLNPLSFLSASCVYIGCRTICGNMGSFSEVVF